MKYIDVNQNNWHGSGCDVGETVLKISGTLMERELSDAWTGFTRFIVLNETPPDGYIWSGERLTRKQTTKNKTSVPDNVWPEMWNHMSGASKRKEKRKWAIEKPRLDNARRLRGIFIVDPDDEEFKRIIKNARRKLEIPMLATMPCRLRPHKHWTKDACIFCGRRVYEDTYGRVSKARAMKTTSQEEAWIHRVTITLCIYLFLCLKPRKY